TNGLARQMLRGNKQQRQDTRLEYSSLPWAERPVQVVAGPQTHELNTDRNGVLRLNLLDGPFAEQHISEIGKLLLTVEDEQDGTRADAFLLVSRNLRGKLQEAQELIYADLAGDASGQWAPPATRLF